MVGLFFLLNLMLTEVQQRHGIKRVATETRRARYNEAADDCARVCADSGESDLVTLVWALKKEKLCGSPIVNHPTAAAGKSTLLVFSNVQQFKESNSVDETHLIFNQ